MLIVPGNGGIVSSPGGIITPWQTVAHDADDFTANGSMTWTVASGDLLEFKYLMIGNTMIVVVVISTSTVGGTPSTQLLINIPNNKQCVGRHRAAWRAQQAGTDIDCNASVNDNGQNIILTLFGGVNWTATTDTTVVFGTLILETEDR